MIILFFLQLTKIKCWFINLWTKRRTIREDGGSKDKKKDVWSFFWMDGEQHGVNSREQPYLSDAILQPQRRVIIDLDKFLHTWSGTAAWWSSVTQTLLQSLKTLAIFVSQVSSVQLHLPPVCCLISLTVLTCTCTTTCTCARLAWCFLNKPVTLKASLWSLWRFPSSLLEDAAQLLPMWLLNALRNNVLPLLSDMPRW